jgi:hypothetical protein
VTDKEISHMRASSSKPAVAQGLVSSAFERTAIVFTSSFLAARSVGSEAHPVEAARTTIVREARALFCQCIRPMRDADKTWSL